MPLAGPSLFAGLSPELCRAIDHSCERTGGRLDAEPVNALTNAAFLLAASFACQMYRWHSDPTTCGLHLGLIFTLVIVGLGSLLLHTVATRWAEWGGVIPIPIFMLLNLWIALSVFLRWPIPVRIATLLAFFAATF